MAMWDESKHPRTGGGRFDVAQNPAPNAPLAEAESISLEDQMLDVEMQFGVGPEQVKRDHLISHALAAIASSGTDDVVFFGGTALSRTLLTDLRLSEDIDLIALGDRREISISLEYSLDRALRRPFGRVSFTPRLLDARHPQPSVMTAGGVRVQIQLLSSEGYPPWPTEVVDIEQRYADAPPARLRVLTPEGFVASKLSAWVDREAPRDLYDLWALARKGSITAEAAALFGQYGPFTSTRGISFVHIPTESEWDAALDHQCIVEVRPREAAEIVQAALNSVA